MENILILFLFIFQSLSNHDFDTGVFPVSVFLYAMKFPVLCANMVARNTSFLYSRVNKSVVLDINGTKVGIVGYIHRHAQMKTKRGEILLSRIMSKPETVIRTKNLKHNYITLLWRVTYILLFGYRKVCCLFKFCELLEICSTSEF